MKNPFDILNIPRSSSKEEIKARWKELAHIHHPDKGGDPEMFIKVKAAYKKALASMVDKPKIRPIFDGLLKRCPTCNGTGVVYKRVPSSFYSTKTTCSTCNGKRYV